MSTIQCTKCAPPPTLLCVVNFPANSGYAWDFIESLYARIADDFSTRQLRTMVAYPTMDSEPRTLSGSAAIPVLLDATLESRSSFAATVRFIRRENVQVLYLTDQPARRFRYAGLRRAGVRYILVHDHVSGEWRMPAPLKRLGKWLAARAPEVNADRIVTVSDYVARRNIAVGLVPRHKVIRVWNGIPIPSTVQDNSLDLRREFGLSDSGPVVMCACRANAVKGVLILLRAFERAVNKITANHSPALLYIGDGPQFAEIQKLRDSLRTRTQVVLTGYRSDVPRLLPMADICVIPSLWQDALPLSVLEPMAIGRAVVATRVGGVPEMIQDGISGILVPPGDEVSLAQALADLLRDPSKRHRLGRTAQARVREHFSPERQISLLAGLLEEGFQRRL